MFSETLYFSRGVFGIRSWYTGNNAPKEIPQGPVSPKIEGPTNTFLLRSSVEKIVR